MEKEFWDEKWKERQIGFHQSVPHKQLTEQFPALFPKDGPRKVLIPLCGKSLDIIWLASRCTQVTGIEFNKGAIEEFFKENNLTIDESGTSQGMPFYRSGNITLVEGDFFNFEKDKGDYDFIYDRASIVALDPQTRASYCQKLISLGNDDTKILLIAFEYDQSKTSGPPFSVPQAQIRELFSQEHLKKAYRIELLHEKTDQPKSPLFIKAGVNSFKQRTYLIQ